MKGNMYKLNRKKKGHATEALNISLLSNQNLFTLAYLMMKLVLMRGATNA